MMGDEMVERVARTLREIDLTVGTPNYYQVARAVIAVMREPNEAMVAAANRNNHPRDIETWQTMIDTALGYKLLCP